jgi:arginase family enzyme
MSEHRPLDTSLFFQPSPLFERAQPDWSIHALGANTRFHSRAGFPDLDGVHMAIFGVLDDPGHARPRSVVKAPDAVRAELYHLFLPPGDLQFADLGDLHPGNSAQDTQHALAETMAELMRRNIIPIVLGGGQGHTFTQYLAYEKLERTANLVCIDGRFDLGEPGQGLAETSYLSHIVLRQPNYLFNFSNLGFQTYLIDQPGIELMDKLYFDVHRLGEVRQGIADVEPVLRNADTVSVDMSAVRRSDAPGTSAPGPNGFHGEEICQLMRYAGVSEKVSSLAIYEMDPLRDQEAVTAQLAGANGLVLPGRIPQPDERPALDGPQTVHPLSSADQGSRTGTGLLQEQDQRPMVDGCSIPRRAGGPFRKASFGPLFTWGLPGRL